LDEYLTLVGTLLGAALGGIIGFVGAYLVEEQHFKKERINEMRDKIYGPMFMEISKILECVRLFKRTYVDRSRMEELKSNYLFFTIGEDLIKRESSITDRLEKYETVRLAAEKMLDHITKKEVLDILQIDLRNEGAEYICLRLLMGTTMASALGLDSAIFLRVTPQDFIRQQTEKWGKDLQVAIRINGTEETLEEFELLYTSVMAKIEKEKLYLTEQEQRKRLIKELESFLEQIEPFVKHKRSPFVLTRFANVVHT
jgi:hypothetical protein